MPCKGPSAEDYANAYKRELDNVTEMLCSLCAMLEITTGLPPINGLKPWYDSHKALDAMRLREENEREEKENNAKALLKSLTKEQIEAVKYLKNN